MANEQNLKPFKEGDDPRRGSKPKGAIHIATRIQNMLNDPEFTTQLVDKDGNLHDFKGNPAEAIIKTAILKAMSGDRGWADWLSKTAYGSKIFHEVETNPIDRILEQYGLSSKAEDTEPEPTQISDKADSALVSYADGHKPEQTKTESTEAPDDRQAPPA